MAMPDPDDAVLTALLRRPLSFRSPFRGEDFAALVLVVAADITPDEQGELAEALVAQGCRYAVCAGVACSTWDDAIDHASVIAEMQGTPHSGLLTTTWHENEPLEEVAFFFLQVAEVDGEAPRNRLALVIGGEDGDLATLEKTLQNVAGRPTMRLQLTKPAQAMELRS
jgi:hypothetical protein